MVKGQESAKEKALSEIATQIMQYSPESYFYFGRTLCPGERFYVMENSIGWKNAIIKGEFTYTGYQSYIPEGYYTITNIYMTQESMKDNPYASELHDQPKSLTEVLRHYEGRTPPLMIHFDTVYEVESEANGDKYYVSSVDQAIPVRSFELHQNELLNQDVRLLYGRNGSYKDYSTRKSSIEDAITFDSVPVSTQVYKCVDIAVAKEYRNGYGATRVVLILEGGGQRIAVRINELGSYDYGYEYTNDDDYYAVMREDTYQKKLAYTEKLHQQYLDKIKAEQAQRRKDLIAKYGANYGGMVADRKVSLGMSMDMVRDAWGYPVTRISQTRQIGTVTVWGYNLSTYVTFFDGKVTAITEGNY